MLEVDVVPYDDHKPALFISAPCSSTEEAHILKEAPHWDSHNSSGPAKHSGDHVRASPCKGIHMEHHVVSNKNGIVGGGCVCHTSGQTPKAHYNTFAKPEHRQ